MSLLCRGLFIISPKGILRQMTINDLPVGRSVDETLRLVKAFQACHAAHSSRSFASFLWCNLLHEEYTAQIVLRPALSIICAIDGMPFLGYAKIPWP